MGSIQNSIVTNNNFIVSLNLLVFSFSKVTNIASNIEMEAVEEGGYNDSLRLIRIQKTSFDTLVLEKGVQTSSMEVKLKVGMAINAGTIMVMHNGSIAKTYAFEYGVITKWETNELDALKSDVFIRRIEISHTGLIEV